MNNFKEKADLIWRVADLLRGDYKQSDYGKVILPLTVIRRLDCVLEPTKQKVLDHLPKVQTLNEVIIEKTLNKVAGFNFHNRSPFNFDKLIADPNNIALNLRTYINGFSASAREILEYFNFDVQIDRMDDPSTDLLFRVVKSFQEIDLSDMESMEMGYVFEDLIRRFSEQSNETAGEHFTPREVIRLMVNVLFIEDRDILTQGGIVRTLYDPACGTGGMLSVGEQYVKELNPDADLKVFGQEINSESYAICKSDMLIKGQNPSNIKFGNTFTVDGLKEEEFDYMLSNPPIQLINATGAKDEELLKEGKLDFNRFWQKMDRSLGNKRKKIAENGNEKGIGFITDLYGNFEENDFVKILPNEYFGYWRVTVEQPLKDEKGKIVKSKGKPKPDTALRDYENIPFLKKDANGKLVPQTIEEYFEAEVKPHLPEAWIDESKTKTGYEINFTKYFYEFKPLRSLSEIKADILELEERTFGRAHNVLEI